MSENLRHSNDRRPVGRSHDKVAPPVPWYRPVGGLGRPPGDQSLVRDRFSSRRHRSPLVPAHPGRAATAQTSFKTHRQLSAGLAVQGLVDRFSRHLPVWPVRVLARQAPADLA